MQFVDKGIQGEGFYPGARGYAGEAFPLGGVMLLGRDFGTKKYYESLAGSPPRSETALTWRHTRDLYLKELCAIPTWCTNYLMGVRIDGSAKGNIKKQIDCEAWSQYEASCWTFLQKQLELQQPKLVVVFGEDNREDLRRCERLGEQFQKYKIYYTKHPHSAIGEKNRLSHREHVADILRLWNDLK